MFRNLSIIRADTKATAIEDFAIARIISDKKLGIPAIDDISDNAVGTDKLNKIAIHTIAKSLIESVSLSNKCFIPTHTIIPNKTIYKPPKIGVGIEAKKVPTNGTKPAIINNTAAKVITFVEATFVIQTTEIFSL